MRVEFGNFQGFLWRVVKRQRGLFFPGGSGKPAVEELLDKLMANTGELSAIVTARELLNLYNEFTEEEKVSFFEYLEQHFNADPRVVRIAFFRYDENPSSANLNKLSRASEPKRHELLRRLNQTPGATHDLVSMRADLLKLLKTHPHLKSVDEDFSRMFSSWFGRGFLELKTINWSTSASILERIIRYEAVHEIKDWEDLRRRIEPENRHCFAFFHPALIDEPLIFVEVAMSRSIPETIQQILDDEADADPAEFDTATFYSISNCQPGLKNISFGNFLIKQVVQELQSEFIGMKTFVTLSPIPGFCRWLEDGSELHNDKVKGLLDELNSKPKTASASEENAGAISQLAATYLLNAKTGMYPKDPVARFHLGNGARVHAIRTQADLSPKGMKQSRGAMVNYMYDLKSIERNHEGYISDGLVDHSDKIKSLVSKLKD